MCEGLRQEIRDKTEELIKIRNAKYIATQRSRACDRRAANLKRAASGLSGQERELLRELEDLNIQLGHKGEREI